MLKSFTPQKGITIEEENIFVYVSRYICRKVSRSACDQCKVMLMPIINCIQFCLRNNIWIFRVWGFCSTSKLNRIGSNERIFGNIPEQIQHMSHKRDPIITFIKDTKSHASCECFTLILHKGLYVPIRLHHVLRENNEHIITSNGRRNEKILKFNYKNKLCHKNYCVLFSRYQYIANAPVIIEEWQISRRALFLGIFSFKNKHCLTMISHLVSSVSETAIRSVCILVHSIKNAILYRGGVYDFSQNRENLLNSCPKLNSGPKSTI